METIHFTPELSSSCSRPGIARRFPDLLKNLIIRVQNNGQAVFLNRSTFTIRMDHCLGDNCEISMLCKYV